MLTYVTYTLNVKNSNDQQYVSLNHYCLKREIDYVVINELVEKHQTIILTSF